MIIPKLELKIEPFTPQVIDHKSLDNLVLSWQQDRFVVLYNHHYTPLVNGDHLRLGNHLITISLNMENDLEKTKQTQRGLSVDHSLAKFQNSPNDILAFLFQKQESSLPASVNIHQQEENEQGNILQDLGILDNPPLKSSNSSHEMETSRQQKLENQEADKDNFPGKKKKPGIWFKNRLIWRKKIET